MRAYIASSSSLHLIHQNRDGHHDLPTQGRPAHRIWRRRCYMYVTFFEFSGESVLNADRSRARDRSTNLRITPITTVVQPLLLDSLILKRSSGARVTVVARSNFGAANGESIGKFSLSVVTLSAQSFFHAAHGMDIRSAKYGNIQGWRPDRCVLYPPQMNV